MTTKPIDTPLYPRRNHATRRQDVARALLAQPEASDRRIARIVAVGRELVREIRREMIRKSQIQSRHAFYRVGADGKTYTLPPKQREAVSLPDSAIKNQNRTDLSRSSADSL